MTLHKIGFIGLGLIGGSIARRLRRLHEGLSIIATAGHASTVQEAYAEGLIENETPCGIDDFYDCDYIFLCAPVQRNIEYLKQLNGHIGPQCIVTDVGSVKSDIHRAVTALGMERQFIGGHPMAGSEKTGLSNAKEYLLENAYYIITPTAQSDETKISAFTELVRSLGAIPMILDYGQHDYATAAISHLPHVIAYSLVNLVRTCDDERQTMRTIAAGGFKDITRIASSSPVMWENICLSNKDQLLKLIDRYMDLLRDTRDAVAREDGDALMEDFTAAKDYRDSLTIPQKGVLNRIYELYLDLLDEAGGIATVATILASNHISIKNIGIIHNREFEDGVLRLELYDKPALDASVALLKKHHYVVYER